MGRDHVFSLEISNNIESGLLCHGNVHPCGIHSDNLVCNKLFSQELFHMSKLEKVPAKFRKFLQFWQVPTSLPADVPTSKQPFTSWVLWTTKTNGGWRRPCVTRQNSGKEPRGQQTHPTHMTSNPAGPGDINLTRLVHTRLTYYVHLVKKSTERREALGLLRERGA